MFRLISVSTLILACSLAAACSEEATPTGPVETPVQVSESFSGTITVNGAATHTFITARAGQTSATLTALAPDSAVIVSFAMGTWNGSYCQITLAKDNATTASSLVGTASAGNFCVRVSDVGMLSAPTDYEITVTHF